MADKKISALTAATTPLAGTEVLPIVQSGTTVKASIANVQAAPVAAASANSVQYLDASKVPSTSANLFFNGTQLGVGGLTSPHCTVGVPNATFGANSNTVGCSFGIDANALTQPFTGFRWTGASAGISGGGFVTQWVTDSVNSTHTEIYNTGATPIVLGVNSTPMFRVEATGDSRIFNGNLVIGTSGKGIDFSATPGTGTSELLADYEEGTWTPTIAGSTTAGTGTYSTQAASYTKVGNRLLFTAYITWSAHTGTGNMRIDGLPFTVTNNDNNYTSVSIYLDSATAFIAGNVLQARNILNSTQLIPTQYLTGGGAPAQVTLPTSGGIVISGQYYI